jgi:hypothetical protein
MRKRDIYNPRQALEMEEMLPSTMAEEYVSAPYGKMHRGAAQMYIMLPKHGPRPRSKMPLAWGREGETEKMAGNIYYPRK